MSSTAESDKLAKIQTWLCSLLEVDDVPDFEINDDTIAALFQMMSQHNTKVTQQDLLKDQLLQETCEFASEGRRINTILKDLELDLNRDLSSKTQKFVKSLSKGADAVECVHPSATGMTVAVAELSEKLYRSEREVELAERNCTVLIEQLKEAKDLKVKLEKQLNDLEAKLPSEKRKVETLKKSSKFHAQKKTDYERKILEAGGRLKGGGFSSSLSHEEIVALGEKAEDLDAKLKPYRMQLNSYRSLPPDLNLARLKLHEALDELKTIEEELHDVFQNIGLT